MALKEFVLDNYSDIKESMYIQASAGTGKTFNITGIVKKLIDEKIKLEEILVVTYTEKAAGELRDRIRAKCPNEDVDNASIFTIHSFCQKTLSEFSFTANQCAKLSLVSDDAIDDFIDRWIRDVLKNNSDFKQLFIDADKQSTFTNNLKRDFKQALSNYYLDSHKNEVESIVKLDQENFLLYGDSVLTFDTFEQITNPHRIEDLFIIEGFEEAWTELNEKLYAKKAEELKNSILTFISEEGTYNFNGNSIQLRWIGREIKEVFLYFRELKKTYSNLLKKKADLPVTKFYNSQIKTLYLAWQAEKEKNKMQSYDDMLRSVREAVCQPDSMLKKQLQKKYRYAIIDEFQDTNQKQWDIFKTVFMEDPNHVIIVVGDPKQSIYSFQGADVNVYENAIKEIARNGGGQYSLATNHRSTDSMVEDCNILFQTKTGSTPFFSRSSAINFTDSNPSHKKAAATYCEKITKPVWIAGSSNQKTTEKSFAKIAVQQILDCCSFENGKTKLQVFDKDKEDDEGYCRELRNVSFHDFAILVRSSSEYTEIERALKKAGIPSLRYKDANLFSGKECTQWISLFNAITAKDFTGKKRAVLSEALFTDFFCIPLDNVESEIFDNPTCQQRQIIIQWQELARQRKWAKLLENIFEVTNIENRLSDLGQMHSLSKIRQIGNYSVDYLYKTDSSLEDLSKHLLRLSTSSDTSIDEGDIVEKGTDFDCVQLMTIHASKGLEFPVVIVPAGLRARNERGAQAWIYHDENKNAKLSFSDYGKKKYQKEEDFERERLFYVAYTRASSILILPLYDKWEHEDDKTEEGIYDFLNDNITTLSEIKDKKGNPLTRMISESSKSFDELKTETLAILQEFKKIKDEKSASHILENDITEEEQLALTKELSSKVPSLSIQKHSYSSLSHKKAASEEMTENGGRIDKDGSDSQKLTLAKYDMAENPVLYSAIPNSDSVCPPAVTAPYNYPKGTKLGIALHEVFEKADFGVSKNDEELGRLIKNCFEKQTLTISDKDPDGWLAYTSTILWNTLNAKLPEITGGTQTGNYFKLSEIAACDKISEAEFNMNTSVTAGAGANKTASAGAAAGVCAATTGLENSALSQSVLLKNYCNGFIDLVFKRNINGNDVYSVLDWKSDSFEASQYSDGELLKKHTDDRYSIQRVLYSYSLIKWLASFYKDESETQIFENHFGGIYYAYVRGCHADTCSGIYARTWKNWQELENTFKQILKDLRIAD